jgi:hypothetical protein
MVATTVSIREFRAHLAEHVGGNGPVAVTRNGQTVGFFIPVRQDLSVEVAALRQAADKFQSMLDEGEGEEILAELAVEHAARKSKAAA